MADETTNENAGNDVATAAQVAAPAVKKTRAPRRPRVAAETITPEVSAMPSEKPAKKTRAKRGSKLAAAKDEKAVAEPKKTVGRAPRSKGVSPKAVARVGSIDDLPDLIKLEEENKQLRKQLSEKLRAENADLRKRLGQG
ncbi:SyrB-like regulator [Rhizobium cauense]|uniref:hypothetical protein n=1 Tax=Rhizobium cauense TaxID=1166683 RepID=UPI0005673306|nr:hypothetical protein [Rhizobium cauense]MBW9114723.1 SyrB-like regulator [Rhizobium cauense]